MGPDLWLPLGLSSPLRNSRVFKPFPALLSGGKAQARTFDVRGSLGKTCKHLKTENWKSAHSVIRELWTCPVAQAPAGPWGPRDEPHSVQPGNCLACKSGVHWRGLLKMLGHPKFKELSQRPWMTKHASWAQKGKGITGEEAACGRAGRAWKSGARTPGPKEPGGLGGCVLGWEEEPDGCWCSLVTPSALLSAWSWFTLGNQPGIRVLIYKTSWANLHLPHTKVGDESFKRSRKNGIIE